MGPLVFSKSIGGGFRIWINPLRQPIMFILFFGFIIAWNLLVLCLNLVWLLAKLAFHMVAGIFTVIINLFSKKETL